MGQDQSTSEIKKKQLHENINQYLWGIPPKLYMNLLFNPTNSVQRL